MDASRKSKHLKFKIDWKRSAKMVNQLSMTDIVFSIRSMRSKHRHKYRSRSSHKSTATHFWRPL